MEQFKIVILFIVLLFNHELSALEKNSRQKRCIVIQKQTGGRADSGEITDDEDYDFKKPLRPKEPALDRLQAARINGVATKKKGDFETIPEFLKYIASPKMDMFRRLRMKNRFKNIF